MVPEDVVSKTLENTTQFYLSMESENQQDPRRHMKSGTPGLRKPRQNKMVTSDTFFPSVTSSRGNTCSQFYAGTKSNLWKVYPMKTESHNGWALQDYTREVECPPSIKMDNAKSELGETWVKHCRTQCIETVTTEPDHPYQNPAKRRIRILGLMVQNAMRVYKVPLGKHDWVQQWCCNVHNATAN